MDAVTESTVCFNCGNEEAEVFLREVLTCNECGSELVVTYNKCNKCSIIWKAAGDEVLSVVGIDAFTSSQGLPYDYILDGIDFDTVPIVEHVLSDNCMEDQIHKCIRCASPAFEIKENLYKCSNDECGFEWEVIKCG